MGRDPRSLELFKCINEVWGLPPGERPRLRVKTFRIKDPVQFPSFIRQLEELFGGMYTVEVRKYGIKAIPAIVVDGEKVLEGEYPSLEKLREILLGQSLVAEAGLGEQLTLLWPATQSNSPPPASSTPVGPAANPCKNCLNCIFYSEERRRCTLYHIPIQNPHHPQTLQ